MYLHINDYIEKGIINPPPTPEERVKMCIKHLNYLSNLKIEKVAVLEIRNHIAWYLKGIKGSNEIKNKIFTIKNLDEINRILNEYLEYIKEE